MELSAVAANRGLEPKKLSGLVRGELDWIVMKALEKDRTRRYDTANGLANDIQRYLKGELVQACPASAGYRFRSFCRRNKRLLATAAVFLSALVVGTAVSTWQAIRATAAEELARTRLEAETEAKDATAAQLRLTQQAEDTARQRLYRALIAQARVSRLGRQIGHRFEALNALAEATRMARDMNLPPTEFLTLRNEAIACLALPDLRVAREWDGWPTGTWRITFAGTLERYARVDRQGVVSIRRVEDDAEIYSLPEMGPGESYILLSPDGQFLCHHGSRFRLWKLVGPEPELVLEEPTGAFGFSQDSRQFARTLADGALLLYDLPSGREVKRFETGPPAMTELAFHPNGRQIAVGHAGGVQIRDLETGRELFELAQAVDPGSGLRLAWHPDGNSLAVAGSDQVIHVWDLAAPRPVARRLEGLKNRGIGCAFNHAGDLLVGGDWSGYIRLWDPRTGQSLFQTPGWKDCICFSPDGRLLAVGGLGNKLMLWDVGSAVGYRTLAREASSGPAADYQGAVHSGGRLLAVGMHDGTHFWDLASGSHLASIKASTNYGVLFEPSGALLTNAADGVRRWPVRADPTSAHVLRVGPPEKLALPGSYCMIARSAGGRVLASAQFDGALVLHQDRPGQPVALGPHEDVRYVAVSPDGRLVATGSHNGTKVRVWDALSGKLERELPVESGSRVGFSPDGKRLGTTLLGTWCSWEVDGWRQGPEIRGGIFAYSPDGKSLALEAGPGAVRLVDLGSGQEYARLEDPNLDRAEWIQMPEVGQLVTTSNDSNSIHVWDLRVIRAELAKMGLDWDLPPYPPPRIDNRQPLQVVVELGDGK